MQTTFTQGIARWQTDRYGNPTYLQRSTTDNKYVDHIVSPDPTVLILAHHDANYVVDITRTKTKAWGPFETTSTRYLWIDVSLLDASISYGSTGLPPIVADIVPSSAINDQHWFDTANTVMRVYNGAKWVEKIRIFLGKVVSATPHAENLGTQVGLNGQFTAGNIILDSWLKPVRISDGTFLTSASAINLTSGDPVQATIENAVSTGMANEYIPKFSVVTIKSGRKILLNRNTNIFNRIGGVVLEDLYEGEVGAIITSGLVRNDQWTFPAADINRTVWCGPTGEITTSAPLVGVAQSLGFVYDVDAIWVSPGHALIIDLPGAVVTPPTPANIPTTVFNAVVASGPAPLTVQFLDSSTNSPTSWSWDFGDPYDTLGSSLQNPAHTYSAAGTYTVALTATNGWGYDVATQANLINVQPGQSLTGATNLGAAITSPGTMAAGTWNDVTVVWENAGDLSDVMMTREVRFGALNGDLVTITAPQGWTTATVNGITVATKNVTSVPSGWTESTVFTVTAPYRQTSMTMSASISSGETDADTRDNVAVTTVEVTV